MMEIYWTDDLVLELLKNKLGQNTDMSVVNEFKSSKALLPSNALILSLVKQDNTIIELTPTTNLLDYIDPKSDKLECCINSCQCNGTIFSLDEIVYNNFNYKKYGGKWSNYAVKIDSLDLRVKRIEGKIVSSLLLINNFYEINKFIKR
jgi:hypothetical protein